ncbi:MAG: hypothetical protein H6741_25720 [Alphaproteobacteria bacterium]|nr:hypothetical protein [Alphaproteobacteria bacterium]MCB9796110.1 hypothetical protein [Alphaproteobacteria bacterium]
MLISTFLLAGALSTGALADDSQSLRYVLTLDGQEVGERTVELKYLTTEAGGEVRIIESWTDLTVPLAGHPYRYQQRLTGQGDTGGFSARIADDGLGRQVQAARAPDGWIVTIAEGEEAKVYRRGADEFDLTSLALLDPSAPQRLTGLQELSVLTAEVGVILSGPLADRGEVIVAVGERSLKAREFLWTLPEGQVRLAYDADGVLLRYTMRVAGRAITATLDAPPEGRSWGSAMEAPVINVGGGGVEETEL